MYFRIAGTNLRLHGVTGLRVYEIKVCQCYDKPRKSLLSKTLLTFGTVYGCVYIAMRLPVKKSASCDGIVFVLLLL